MIVVMSQQHRRGWRPVAWVLLAVLMAVPARAQDACQSLIAAMTAIAEAQCEDVADGELCVRSAPTQMLSVWQDAPQTLNLGAKASLGEVATVLTGAADPTSMAWGIAQLQVGPVAMTLFGDASLHNRSLMSTSEPATAMVRNSAGYPINLRQGPGTQHVTVGVLDENLSLTANGRSADGQWYRLNAEAGDVWVFHNLVSVTEGDADALPIADNPYSQPMQAMRLLTDTSDAALGCDVATSGLILQADHDSALRVQINGVQLVFAQATLLVQSDANALNVQVMDGTVEARAQNSLRQATSGQALRVALSGDQPSAAPEVLNRYAFAQVAGAPLTIMDEAGLQCVAGLAANGTRVATFGGPGDAYNQAGEISLDEHFIVEGYATDEAGESWWQLDNNRWVPQRSVRTAGLCETVAAVAPPQLQNASQPTSTENLVPEGQSVWQAESGPDVMSGTCEGVLPLAVCSHPAAIITQPDGSIHWRGQEPVPYPMSPLDTNTYFHTGRNFQNTGTITLTLTMTSADTWSMTMEQVFDAHPGCTHTFYYTGTRRW